MSDATDDIDAAGWIRAAADCLRDARTDLRRARDATDDDTVDDLVGRLDDQAAALAHTMNELAINADLAGEDGASTPPSADLREDNDDE
jgi:hypothetical protein